MIRKAVEKDIPGVVRIYDAILDREEAGLENIGWVRGVYPARKTAEEALEKDELFVLEEDGEILAAAKINQEQMPAYIEADWEYAAPDEEVMVLHTLVVFPGAAGRGIGTEFVNYYEAYALLHGCHYLRIDTNKRNKKARALYKKLGYREAGIIDCNFNGIKGVPLVCLEKKLSGRDL